MCIVVILVAMSDCEAQHVFRRHFIVAYDVSGPFIKAERSLPAYQVAVRNLFENKAVKGFHEANPNNLEIEQKNGLRFFDPRKDEISFFHFNVARSEFSGLQDIAKDRDEDQITRSFTDVFLKDKGYNWSKFSERNGETLEAYFEKIFKCPATPSDFGNGVSMSNFVYPLVLSQIDQSKYAEEYILVLLSDFKTGSMLGNKLDLDRVRDIFQVAYNVSISSKSPVSFIKKEIDFLSSRYYKIDFFEYAFLTPVSDEPIGVIVSKVKPKVGILAPEDVALFVDGEWELDQRGYHSTTFRTSPTEIRFTHNQDLTVTEIRLTISMAQAGKEKVIFDDVVATRSADSWTSNYSNSEDVMQFDKERNTYHVPKFDLALDSAILNNDFDHLRSRFAFKAKYKTSASQQLNFIYATERSIAQDGVHYSTKATIIIMYVVLPIVVILALVVFLILYGKPKGITLTIDGYLDTFEVVDFKKSGRMTTPYLAWNSDDPVQFLVVRGAVHYKSPAFPFNWNSPIILNFLEVVAPSGFELFLKPSVTVIQEFESGIPMRIRRGKNNNIQFVVGVRQNDITLNVENPELVKFRIEALISDARVIAIKTDVREEVGYSFHLGGGLGDVCVAFDPGTTGSCVAIGSANDNIILIEDVQNQKIIPSVIVFETQQDLIRNSEEVPKDVYKHGSVAKGLMDSPGYLSFQSFKKLLGFKNKKKILFKNKVELELSGRDLGSLLVKGLYQDLLTFLNRKNIKAEDYYSKDKRFNPQKAVVAIPNNFTVSKIQDIIDCIAGLKQFKEIRYVYEAEAVLFYYLSNFKRLNGVKDFPNSETIFIFDMGGATINATIVTSTLTQTVGGPKYEIDFLGKIGYGIGGDTIDYCISQFVLTFKTDYPDLLGVDPSRSVPQLLAMAFEIKKSIIENYKPGAEYLITNLDLERVINGALKTNITIDPETSKLYEFFRKNALNEFALFDEVIFRDLVYKQIADSCNEVVKLSGAKVLHKVLFSGRSTAFPNVREIVEGRLLALNIKPKYIHLDLEESKTAVAMGACWYGLNRNAVKLNHMKTSASFGFRKALSADKTSVQFYELVETGRDFDSTVDGVRCCGGQESIRDSFALDGSKVNFYQIMGEDANYILASNQKHKYSKVASISVPQLTSQVAMRVNENDIIECLVQLESNKILRANGVVSDQEIADANDDHYTWNVK